MCKGKSIIFFVALCLAVAMVSISWAAESASLISPPSTYLGLGGLR